jgi:hypothetical protein
VSKLVKGTPASLALPSDLIPDELLKISAAFQRSLAKAAKATGNVTSFP